MPMMSDLRGVGSKLYSHVTTILECLCSDPTKGGPSLGSGSKARAQRPWPALAYFLRARRKKEEKLSMLLRVINGAG